MPGADSFVRVPTGFLEALLRIPLNGTQWRIIFWVVRQTYGWNRNTTGFSWYRIARDLSLDRGGVVRAGNHLLRSGILQLEGDHIGITQGVWTRQRIGWAPLPGGPVTDVSADGHIQK